ncbi:hypothetical protein AAMO2058_000307200 [Amorphochlora amoebiformis]
MSLLEVIVSLRCPVFAVRLRGTLSFDGCSLENKFTWIRVDRPKSKEAGPALGTELGSAAMDKGNTVTSKDPQPSDVSKTSGGQPREIEEESYEMDEYGHHQRGNRPARKHEERIAKESKQENVSRTSTPTVRLASSDGTSDDADNEPGLYEAAAVADEVRNNGSPAHTPHHSHKDHITSPRHDQHELFREPTIRNIRISKGIESFNSGIFLRFFLYHALYPASIPFVYLFDGPHYVRNLCFIPTSHPVSIVVFIIQVVGSSAAAILIALHAINPNPPPVIFLIIPLCLFLQHRLMVGTKYGMLDPATHEWLTNQTVDREILKSIELSNWGYLDIAEIDHQLRYSAAQSGIDTSSLYFYLQPSIYKEAAQAVENCSHIQEIKKFYEAKKEELLRKNELLKRRGTVGSMAASSHVTRMDIVRESARGAFISKKDLTDQSEKHPPDKINKVGSQGKDSQTSAESKANPKASPKMPKFDREKEKKVTTTRTKGSNGKVKKFYMGKEMVSGLVKVHALPIATRMMYLSTEKDEASIYRRWIWTTLQGLIPIVTTAIWNDSFKQNNLAIGEAIVGFLMTGFFFNVALVFLDVGRIDYQRRAYLIQSAGALINYEQPFSDECGAELFVDLAWPKNVSSWLDYRRLLLNAGSQYRTRMTLYTSYVTAFLIGLIIYALAGVLTNTLSVVTVSTVAGFLLFTGYVLSLSIWYGSATNEQFTFQARSLSRIQFKLRELMANQEGALRAYSARRKKLIETRLERADDMIEAATRLLSHDAQLEPVTILGFQASKELFTTSATVIIGAVVAVLIEYYFNQQE